jgi:hypothetical protein
MMHVNSSATNNDNTIESGTQEILSKVERLPVQHEVVKGEVAGEANSHLSAIKSELEDAFKEVEELLNSDEYAKNAGELEMLEKEIVRKTDRLAGLLIGYKVQQSVDSEELSKESQDLIKACPKKLKNQGKREVKIQPLRGELVSIKVSYFSQKGKKDYRKKKRRGFYPGLVLLGIYDHYTPGIASEISLMATVASSYEEARQLLKEQGHEVDIKTIRSLTISYAQRARAALLVKEGSFTETVSGRKVVISTDGGRVRIRQNKKGAKTKKGRRHYRTDWREPKMLIIYIVDENGQMERTFSPFIDGTLKGPDAIFWLLNYYLSRLHIDTSDSVLFVADGARWIWNRVAAFLSSLGLVPGHYYELVDFYHAVEHLGKVANLQKGWKKPQKKRWLTTYRRLLLKGKIDEVITEIRRLCRGRRSKKLRTERDYFCRNRGRMNYAEIRQKGLPIGSGAIESVIRRVVNQKLKGASIYWLRENAEAMLMLRSYFKAGRWNMLKQLTFSVLLPDII